MRSTRRGFLKAMGLAAASLAVPRVSRAAEDAAKTRPPNFIVIFTDDQGYRDVGCYGAQGFETPNLDRMAAEGMRFTDFYAAAPVCTPSRAALVTGCYPLRVGLPYVLGPKEYKLKGETVYQNMGISSEEETIADILKTRGYATACYGKWHLGVYREFLPMRHGFDDYFGLPYSNDMWEHHPEPDNFTFPPLPLIDGEKIVQYDPDQTQLTTWYTERAVTFIEENKDHPFFLYLPHSMPHVPLHVSGKFKGKSKQGMYGDVIMEIDWSVGEIMATLKRLGIDEQTLVIFTSDNGPSLSYGDHGGSALPLRNGKATTFDGGMREPCIMRWPGKIPPGSECRELATTMDILPTLANLAGARHPTLPIDGKDIWPLMAGQPGAKTPHEALFYYFFDTLQAVRFGKWKLHLPHPYAVVKKPGTGGKPGKWVPGMQRLSLFDIEKDIGESRNVADEHPEIVKQLQDMAKAFDEELKRTARPVGTVPIQKTSSVPGN